MALLFVASALIARIVERFTWLIDLAAVVLAWTAAGLVLEDALVKRQFPGIESWDLYVRLGAVALILFIDLGLRLARRRAAFSSPQTSASPLCAGDDVLPAVTPQVVEEASVARDEASAAGEGHDRPRW
jgi:hypothetical protein